MFRDDISGGVVKPAPALMGRSDPVAQWLWEIPPWLSVLIPEVKPDDPVVGFWFFSGEIES